MNSAATTASPRESGQNRAGPAAGAGRVLAFMVVQQPQEIRELLDQLPPESLASYPIDLLILNDSADQEGLRVATGRARAKGFTRVTFLRNPVNQGYGGIQKLAFRYALDAGYELVIPLRGGQPDFLPRAIERWRQRPADVILGTWHGEPGSPRPRGLWRHRLLARMRHRLTGRRFEGPETGHRAFSGPFLGRVPFELNSNDALFDTEILLQALHVNATLEELPASGPQPPPLPQHNIFAVLAAMLQWKLHQMGMLCSLKFRGPGHERYGDKTYMAYSSHQIAMREVQRLSPARVLDLGCGPGYVAKHVAAMGAQVTGVDAYEPASGAMHRFVRFDLESGPLPLDAWDYDVVLLLDVIEHLAEPEKFLLDLRNGGAAPSLPTGAAAQTPPTLILSTPNVAFAAVRLNLLLGRFTYADRGILDITHKRLFTRRTLLRALHDCGYDVERVLASGAPFAAVVGGRIGRVLGTLTGWMATVWPTMFAFQFVVRCRPRPGVRRLLAMAQRGAVDEEPYSGHLEEKPAVGAAQQA